MHDDIYDKGTSTSTHRCARHTDAIKSVYVYIIILLCELEN